MNIGGFIENFDIYSKRIPLRVCNCNFTGDEKRNLRSFTDTPYWSNSPKNPSGINEIMKFLTLKYFCLA